ncbi:MAG: amidohydrolase family protein [Aureliella sp.]
MRMNVERKLGACAVVCAWLLAGGTDLAASDQIPGARQTKPIAIVNAQLHTVSGETISKGTILFSEGKIVDLGADLSAPSDATVIDAEGGHVYPGLIDPLSKIGLVEIDAVRATLDWQETGTLNPNVRAAAAFNPDSELIPVARSNGVLLAVSAPDGGLISGRSALMMLDGWTWEQMTLKPDVGMQVNWPRTPEATANREGADAEMALLEKTFDQAERYRAALGSNSPPEFDARLASLVPVLEGKVPLIATAFRSAQIRSAVAFAKQRKLRLIIYGGYDALDCQEVLLAEKVPVIVAGVYRLPARRDQPYDDAYTLPSRLKAAGIPFCIATAGRFGGSMIRNLPYHAATAAAYGLEPAEALRSITLSAAEILGVADRVGSLAKGLDATLLIADGDILETPTHVTHAFIQGRAVDLSNRQTQLYDKYRVKYEQE